MCCIPVGRAPCCPVSVPLFSRAARKSGDWTELFFLLCWAAPVVCPSPGRPMHPAGNSVFTFLFYLPLPVCWLLLQQFKGLGMSRKGYMDANVTVGLSVVPQRFVLRVEVTVKQKSRISLAKKYCVRLKSFKVPRVGQLSPCFRPPCLVGQVLLA